jgi:hypothetical protein
MSLTRDVFVKDCIHYIRKITEAGPDSKGAVVLPSGATGGFVQYFQSPIAYKAFRNYKNIRDIIVDQILDPPSIVTDDLGGGYKIIYGGVVANTIIDLIRSDSDGLRFPNLMLCQEWITQVYQVVVNYVDSWVNHLNDLERYPVAPPVPKDILTRVFFENIAASLQRTPGFDLTIAIPSPLVVYVPGAVTTPDARSSVDSMSSPSSHLQHSLSEVGSPSTTSSPSEKKLSPFTDVSAPRFSTLQVQQLLSRMKLGLDSQAVNTGVEPPIDEVPQQQPPEIKRQRSSGSALHLPLLTDNGLSSERAMKINAFFVDVQRPGVNREKLLEKLSARLTKYQKEGLLLEETVMEVRRVARSFTGSAF